MCSDTEAPPHRITIIIAIVAIAATVIGSVVGAFLTNQGATDQWNRQMSFDKQGAAQQFSIEITSLNDTLQAYASEYSQNKDITCGGSEVIINPNKTTALMLGGGIPYLLVFNKGSIASYRGYPNYTDIGSQVSVVGYKFPNAPEHPTFQSCEISVPIIPPTLYDEHGMYYNYIKDIPKFNPVLAKSLNFFYNDITSAESKRAYIQNYLDSNNVPPIGTRFIKHQYFSAYMDMRMNIIEASKLEPVLVDALNSQSISK